MKLFTGCKKCQRDITGKRIAIGIITVTYLILTLIFSVPVLLILKSVYKSNQDWVNLLYFTVSVFTSFILSAIFSLLIIVILIVTFVGTFHGAFLLYRCIVQVKQRRPLLLVNEEDTAEYGGISKFGLLLLTIDKHLCVICTRWKQRKRSNDVEIALTPKAVNELNILDNL